MRSSPASTRKIKALDADIYALTAQCELIARAVKTLVAIKGVGDKTAALIALMPEPGSLPRRQAAALAGLAPHPRQSGEAEGCRRARGGRPEVKSVLFIAALSARKHNPTLKPFSQRLVQAGKKPLVVATTAIKRKLVAIANANALQLS